MRVLSAFKQLSHRLLKGRQGHSTRNVTRTASEQERANIEYMLIAILMAYRQDKIVQLKITPDGINDIWRQYCRSRLPRNTTDRTPPPFERVLAHAQTSHFVHGMLSAATINQLATARLSISEDQEIIAQIQCVIGKHQPQIPDQTWIEWIDRRSNKDLSDSATFGYFGEYLVAGIHVTGQHWLNEKESEFFMTPMNVKQVIQDFDPFRQHTHNEKTWALNWQNMISKLPAVSNTHFVCYPDGETPVSGQYDLVSPKELRFSIG